ncbi:MAG: phosphoesterase [Bacteroidia bacterium]|nr:phosphoesterase [Bacteroidia bacterium]
MHPLNESTKQNLDKIEHIVVVMFENRSFDHMLGFLYEDSGNKSPLGHDFEGLTGNESNPYTDKTTGETRQVPVYKIPEGEFTYYMPKADPGEGFPATNEQLYGTNKPQFPFTGQTNQGFVNDFAYSYVNIDQKYFKPKDGIPPTFPNIQPEDIMGMFTPAQLPILSGLAKGFAVCDHWYCSIPTETVPNRSFLHAATSQGILRDSDEQTKKHYFYTAPTIFPRLDQANVSWKIYGYNALPLARASTSDLKEAPLSNFGLYSDFQHDLWGGNLASYTFLEPHWGPSGNSQHPNYDVSSGEKFLYNIYQSLRKSEYWEKTLLVVTYDEHGGCYDHVLPPGGAAQPNAESVNTQYYPDEPFKFDRFGVRVPAVLISPYIQAGTVFRVPEGTTPIDHTSVLATIEAKWNILPLTARDAAAPHLGGVLTLDQARTDDPLQGITPPVNKSTWKPADTPSHLQLVHAGYVRQHYDYRSEDEWKNDCSWDTGTGIDAYIHKWTNHDRRWDRY